MKHPAILLNYGRRVIWKSHFHLVFFTQGRMKGYNIFWGTKSSKRVSECGKKAAIEMLSHLRKAMGNGVSNCHPTSPSILYYNLDCA